MKKSKKTFIKFSTKELLSLTPIFTKHDHFGVRGFLPHFTENMELNLAIDQLKKGISRIERIKKYEDSYRYFVKKLENEK